MAHIFISYSRVDNEDGGVRYFVERLRKGRPDDSVWWDEELRGGDVWWQEILAQVQQCDIFVYLLSNESVSSPYCQAEYFEARRLQKLILTVQVRGRTDIPDELGEIQYVDMTGVDKTDAFVSLFAALAKLSKRIPTKVPRPLWAEPTPRPKKIPTVKEEKAAAPEAESLPLPALPSSSIALTPAARSRFSSGWLVMGAAALIALIVVALILASNNRTGSENSAPPTTSVAQNASDTAPPTDQPTLTNTPPPTNTLAPTEAPTPTVSETEYEQLVQTQIAGIQTEAAQTAIAQVTATQAMGTAFAQMTVYALATEAAYQTATATLWTATFTPDSRRTAEARLTQTEQANRDAQATQNAAASATQGVVNQTATATQWTATPTPTNTPTPTFTPSMTPTLTLTPTPIPPGYPGGELITANNQWQSVTQVIKGVEMVLVPVGCFQMGSEDGSSDEQPVNEQCFEQPFWLDKTEVTNAQFASFGGAAGDPGRWTEPKRPRERITWFEARDYCALRGGRLPTEREWEYAARGPDNLKYPWGNDFIAENVVYSGNSNGETAEVGSRPGGKSWVGALDMSGNVWEWTGSLYQGYPYVAGDGREADSNSTGVQRAVRGGSFDFLDLYIRASSRGRGSPDFFDGSFGFRCLLSYP